MKKQIKKGLGLMLLLFAMAFSTTTYASSSAGQDITLQTLQTTVGILKQSLPQPMNDMITWQDVSLKNNMFCMDMVANLSASQWKEIKANSASMKDEIMEGLLEDDDDGQSFVDMLISAGCGLKITISCKKAPGSNIVYSFTAEQLKNMR